LALIKIEGGEGRAERPDEALGEFIVETMGYRKLLTEPSARRENPRRGPAPLVAREFYIRPFDGLVGLKVI
jgi:hypothetical protein